MVPIRGERATLPMKAMLSIDPSATVAVRASSRSATSASTPIKATTVLMGVWAVHYAARACPASLPSNSRSASALSSVEIELLMLPRKASTFAATTRAASVTAVASASALATASSAATSLDALAAAAAVSAAARSRSSTTVSSASCRRRVLKATER
ncbi:uncharacterized protein [Miscanthus floridulus]|uniref:uncharacterized protein n=1 Tax=Miscanthus floridulus TaxID=154761 RepID=UPI00345AAAB4